MRNILSTIVFVLGVGFVLSAQNIIENQEKPLSKNVGQMVELIEVMRIDDMGGDYYFKYPRSLKIAPDGSVFVTDYEQLLQFNSNGKFLRNYFKKGQGPGEMQEVGDYFFSENNLIVQDRRLQKILWFGFNGKYIKEFKIIGLPIFSRLHLIHGDTYYFFGNMIPSTEGKPSVIDVSYDLFSVAEEGVVVEKLTSFPVESFAISAGGGGAMASIAEMTTVPYKGKYLILSHTQDYLLKIYDVEARKIVRSFKRKYRRVELPKGRRIGEVIGVGGKTYRAPRKYLNDIAKLFIIHDHIWVMTSIVDKKKGVLIDVFDFNGRYIDNFYLKFPGEIDSILIGYRQMTIYDGYLYEIVKNEDETFSIVKYRIEGKAL